MKLNTVHVDIVSEEKNFMAIMSWRQFAYCAVFGITAYKLTRWFLETNFSLFNLLLACIFFILPAFVFTFFLGFVHLEDQDMFLDKWLWYWLQGKREHGIYRYKEDDVL